MHLTRFMWPIIQYPHRVNFLKFVWISKTETMKKNEKCSKEFRARFRWKRKVIGDFLVWQGLNFNKVSIQLGTSKYNNLLDSTHGKSWVVGSHAPLGDRRMLSGHILVPGKHGADHASPTKLITNKITTTLDHILNHVRTASWFEY